MYFAPRIGTPIIGGGKRPLVDLSESRKAQAFANFKAAKAYNKTRDNGQLSRRGMVWVGQGEQLRPRAAKAFVAMQKAARSQGISLGVTDAYRTLKEQKDLANQIGLYGPGNRQGAAVPGTSMHGMGRAVDVSYGPKSQNSLDSYGTAQSKWLQENAGRFGFKQSVPGEPWHISFSGKQFDKSVIKGINLKVTDSGRVKAVAGPGFNAAAALKVKPTWTPGSGVTDAKDLSTYEGANNADTNVETVGKSGDLTGAAATLSSGKVF